MAQYNNRNKFHRNGRQEQDKINLEKIKLNYKENQDLFGNVAEKWSKQLYNESNSTINKSTQIRSFYDKVLELNEKAQRVKNDEQYIKEVFPFVVMLKSKVAYAKTRGLVSHTFVTMINQCVEDANTIEKMQNFKYFFEAVIGFYPKK